MVEKIESYRFSKQFKKEYNALSKEIQKAFDKKLALFIDDTTHFRTIGTHDILSRIRECNTDLHAQYRRHLVKHPILGHKWGV
jgi:mRNA-degrading endonuclease RelE of RelBE toxin-antitoxin system